MKKSSKKNGISFLKGKSVHFDDQYLRVELQDGRVISTPMKWYKELQQASFQQLTNYKFICQRTGVEWPELDYHLSIESMILGQLHEKVA